VESQRQRNLEGPTLGPPRSTGRGRSWSDISGSLDVEEAELIVVLEHGVQEAKTASPRRRTVFSASLMALSFHHKR
jgi:hypothetical protein